LFSFLLVFTHGKTFTYDAAFKKRVILCVDKTGNCATGRKYAVSCIYKSLTEYKNKALFVSGE
jgi:hypothetical protein